LLSSDEADLLALLDDEQGVLLDKMDHVVVWNTLLELYLMLLRRRTDESI